MVTVCDALKESNNKRTLAGTIKRDIMAALRPPFSFTFYTIIKPGLGKQSERGRFGGNKFYNIAYH